MRLLKLIAVVGLTLITALALPAQTVRVIFTSGTASIQRPDEPALRPVVKGESVIIGSRIVTGADGRVVLTPMPGVKSIIAPNTTLLLESVSENRTSPTEVTHQAVLDLKSGSVVSDLQKPEGVTYDYSIRTARGLAGARGTNYTVAINSAGIETVLVSHGTITFNLLNGSQVSVTAGQIQITDTTGAVRTAAKLGDLSDADQAFAQEVAESTLGALEAAVAGGVEINPDAISQALDLFESFGLDVSESTLQRINQLREALEALKKESTGEESKIVTKTIKDEEEEAAEPGILETFIASLTPDQAVAFQDLLTQGGFNTADSSFLAKLQQTQFRTDLLETINLYRDLDIDQRNQLVTLGILGNANTTAVGAKSAGLASLVSFYTEMDLGTPLIASAADYNGTSSTPISPFAHVFFPGSESTQGFILYNALFDSSPAIYSNLYIGGTRELLFENTLSIGSEYTNFIVASYNDLHLRAADIVSLKGLINKPVNFSYDIRGIVMQAYTINLLNVNIPEGSVVSLNSFNGGLYFNGPSVIGGVNFLGGVFYGEYLLDSLEAFNSGSRGNIAIGSLANPAPLPSYTPTPFQLFRQSLTTDQRDLFDALPDPVQQKIFNLNDPVITGTVLALDPVNAVPYTSTSIDRILDAYIALSTTARTFVKTLGDADTDSLNNVEGTPYIEAWSTQAIEDAATLFNTFDSNTQNTLVALGAGDAILGINGDYVQGLLVAVSGDITALTESGWGRHLQDLVNDSALSDGISAARDADSAQRALIKKLDIEPFELVHVLNQVLGGNSQLIYDRLDYIINEVSPADLDVLASVGFNSTFNLFANSEPDVLADINAIVAHYNSLDAAQQKVARTLRLGTLLIDNTDATTIIAYYNGLTSEKQEAFVDTDLVTEFYDSADFAATQNSITAALNTYIGLPSHVRNFLLTEAEHFDLLPILTSTGSTDNEGRTSRSLTNIVSLLNTANASPERYAALLDLDLGKALVFQGYLEAADPAPLGSDPTAGLIYALSFYENLPNAQKGTLRELGIIGSDHVGFLGKDYTGVERLLTAYAALPTATRVDTQQIDEKFTKNKTYSGHTSYFLPFNKNTDAVVHSDGAMVNVAFASDSHLYVGAVRRLRIDNTGVGSPSTTFTVPGINTHVVKLRAGDLIDLNGASYSSNAAGIIMDAITINLANFDFPEGTVAALNSLNGGTANGSTGSGIYPHWGGSEVGRVNFLTNVTYGGQALDNTTQFDTNARGNIAIGSHASPASLPTYNAPPLN